MSVAAGRLTDPPATASQEVRADIKDPTVVEESTLKRAVVNAGPGNTADSSSGPRHHIGGRAQARATMSATLPAMFPAGIRYGSVSIAFNVSVSIFGGTVPLVTQSLISATGDDNIVAYYLMGAAAIGLVAAYFTKDTAQQPTPGPSPTITKKEKEEQLGQQGEMAGDRESEQRRT